MHIVRIQALQVFTLEAGKKEVAADDTLSNEVAKEVAAHIDAADVERLRGCKLWWPSIDDDKALATALEQLKEQYPEEMRARREKRKEELVEEEAAARRQLHLEWDCVRERIYREEHREESQARDRRFRAQLKADTAAGRACLYGRKCLEDPTNTLVGKVKMQYSVCSRHVGRYEAIMQRQTEAAVRRPEVASDFEGPAFYRQMLDAAKEISHFIYAPGNLGLARALASEGKIV
ncbi:hypothetical protein BGZ68_007044 [Mortierella alpina]|nr:hypothetical protein BGZ68_007044 [Mortierella alpina]